MSGVLYKKLTLHDQPQPVDVIFVMAGRMERKSYGLDLFRAGLAPRLVLSVGRFEVTRTKRFQLPGCDELISLRDKTPPNERHFFVEVNGSVVQIRKVKLAAWNTYGEALGLREWLKDENVRHVMVISTDIHLRRVALSFSKVFQNLPEHFVYCPVPCDLSSLKQERWWTRPNDRGYVLKELCKLTGYRMILSMPPSAIRWLMRLK
jgi:hypothetical protein